MFYFEQIQGRKILKSDIIRGAEAFFTTRELCIKTKPVENPNAAVPVEESVIAGNKKIICDYLGIDVNNLLSPKQTHTANVDVAAANKIFYPDTDGLILTDKSLGVFLNFADCTPVILYDEKLNIGAVVHAGWRGTAQKIAPAAAAKMGSEFGSNPENIAVVIGPAIGFCCYNVGEEVLIKLKHTVENFADLSEIRNGNIFVDLKNINRQQLVEFGIQKIDVCPYCTVHNNDLFYSYRKENATPNRHSALLSLKR